MYKLCELRSSRVSSCQQFIPIRREQIRLNYNQRNFLVGRKASSEADVDLWKLQEELLKQIEEKQRLVENLKDRLHELSIPTDDSEPFQPPPPPQRQQPPPTYQKPVLQQNGISQKQFFRSEQTTIQQVPVQNKVIEAEPIPKVAQTIAVPKPQPVSLQFPTPVEEVVVKPPVREVETQAEIEEVVEQISGEGAVGQELMNIVFVGAECAPWSKTGGLGDVMGALPKALAKRGHRVMAISPRYDFFEDGWETGVKQSLRVMNQDVEVGYFHGFVDGVDFVFVDHPCYHGRRGGAIYEGERLELGFRCALLSKAALEAVWHVPCGGVPYGDSNLLFIANDWHTALLPVYLQAHYRDYDQMTFARCLFVLHNIAHQGRAPFVELSNYEVPDNYSSTFFLDDPVGGEHMNIMKAGMILSHRIVAVSHGYAWECQTQDGGWGLDSILREHSWKLTGIVNGIDYSEWSPVCDQYLDTDGYTRYGIANMVEGKRQCKRALQKELGLPVDDDIPLFGFIGRLDYQKGVDLIAESYDWLMSEGVQLAMLGSGREDLEGSLRGMENNRPNQCRCWVGFSVQMAHRITAACDILLMPSRFEPCGLNQLYAMSYGTVPLVHAVGGLRDTVKQYDPYSDVGTGWTFERAEGNAMRDAVANALNTYRNFRDSFQQIQKRGMEQDLSWDHAAEQYEKVLIDAKYQW